MKTRSRIIVAGRTYTVEFRTSLTSGTWQPLTDTTSATQKFYRVQVSKP